MDDAKITTRKATKMSKKYIYIIYDAFSVKLQNIITYSSPSIFATQPVMPLLLISLLGLLKNAVNETSYEILSTKVNILSLFKEFQVLKSYLNCFVKS